jgi:multidrug efflux pump subunit AcrA (membrane-fusion protein)
MSDITASERRLRAALDRMDKMLDVPPRPAEAAAPAPSAADDGALAELQARLDAATEQAAGLSAANEELIIANRDLLEAQETGGIGADEQMAALQAELSALRAARAAEMAQMSEIMAELERLLADEPPILDGAVPDEAGGDAGGLPEDLPPNHEER